MPRWQQPYLGSTELPSELSQFELDLFFTFTPEELAALKTRYKPALRIGAALQLGFLKMTGCTILKFKVVPRKLLGHLGKQLGELAPSIASIRSLYKRTRTRYEHQNWAIEVLGFGHMSDKQKNMLTARLREEAKSASSQDLLMQYAREWLFARKLLIPSSRNLRDLARRALSDVEQELYKSVTAAVPARVLGKWLQELSKPSKTGGSTVEWLYQGPKRGARKGLETQYKRLEFLQEVGVPQYQLDQLSLEKQRFYAKRMRNRRPSRLQELSVQRRTLEIVCFLRVALMHTTDAILHMTRNRTSDLMRESAQDALKEDARSALTYREAIQSIREFAESRDLNDTQIVERIRDVLTQLNPKVYKSRAAAMREKMFDRGDAVRGMLRSIGKLPIEGSTNEPVFRSLEILQNAYERNETRLSPDFSEDVSPIWVHEINDDDRVRAFRALEISTLMGLRKALRHGTVWAKDSIVFRNPELILIPTSHWEKNRRRWYSRLGISEGAKAFYTPVLNALEKNLELLANLVEEGIVSINGDTLRISPVTPEVLPKDLASIRDALFRKIGDIQLPELMLEIDSHIHFSRHLLGHVAQSERELLPIYGAVIAHGTELDASGVALMTPGLSASQVLVAMRGLEDEKAFRRANEDVSSFLRSHNIAKYWGEGNTASSDMMSLEASRHLWRARIDPRRGVPAIGVYQHVLDQWGVIYDMPIVLLNRQAGAAIEGVIRQTEVDIERLSVDTHGYTDFGMAVAKLLGFDLCPRLKNLKERKLYVPRSLKVPSILEPVVNRDVSLRAIDKGWDELIRVVASVEDGTTSAVMALERFGSAARGDMTHSAGVNLGRILRSLFLCDYFGNPVFRRELHRILNRGESLHALERSIYTGRLAPARGRRADELVATSGALTLLTNLAMAWTTSRLQVAVDEWQNVNRQPLSPEILAHIAPVHYGNINFRGTFRFPFERYRDRLWMQGAGKLVAVSGA